MGASGQVGRQILRKQLLQIKQVFHHERGRFLGRFFYRCRWGFDRGWLSGFLHRLRDRVFGGYFGGVFIPVTAFRRG